MVISDRQVDHLMRIVGSMYNDGHAQLSLLAATLVTVCRLVGVEKANLLGVVNTLFDEQQAHDTSPPSSHALH